MSKKVRFAIKWQYIQGIVFTLGIQAISLCVYVCMCARDQFLSYIHAHTYVLHEYFLSLGGYVLM